MKFSRIIILFVCTQQWWGNVFQSARVQMHVKKLWKIFFIKRFDLQQIQY